MSLGIQPNYGGGLSIGPDNTGRFLRAMASNGDGALCPCEPGTDPSCDPCCLPCPVPCQPWITPCCQCHRCGGGGGGTGGPGPGSPYYATVVTTESSSDGIANVPVTCQETDDTWKTSDCGHGCEAVFYFAYLGWYTFIAPGDTYEDCGGFYWYQYATAVAPRQVTGQPGQVFDIVLQFP